MVQRCAKGRRQEEGGRGQANERRKREEGNGERKEEMMRG